MKLTYNFSKSEFDSKDGAKMPLDVLANIKKLAKQLQILRQYCDMPIVINSGYRSPNYNDVILPSKGIKTSKNSQHKLGKAADIVILGFSAKDTYALIEYLIGKGILSFKGLGRYKQFTHVDLRENEARW